MRTWGGVLVLAASLCGSVDAWAAGAGGGRVNVPAPRAEQTPEDRAQSAYRAGVQGIRKADELDRESAAASDAGQREKLAKRAAAAYRKSLARFESAVRTNPQMHEAWNYLGYARRKLGDYEAALTAYDRALELRPGYPEAVEYRGEAYLRLNRLEDAKRAYLELFAGHRALSDQLLGRMREWVSAQRAGTPDDPAAVDALAQWIEERATIAAQTAALTRAGAASTW